MKITVLTLFPEMFAPVLGASILGRARQAGHISVDVVDIRPFSARKHQNADDAPFGGGAGMVMLAQPICDAMDAVTGPDFLGRRVYLSPRGTVLTQRKAEELAAVPHLVLLCGHYEGVDQRALDLCVDEELSIGDYVLTGGELAAMVVVDCVARLVPGVLGNEGSAQSESFSGGLLEYPHYTRPRTYRGLAVPDVLLGGNHAQIEDWRFAQSYRLTLARRPDLLANLSLDKRQRRIADEVER
ncbi:MAG: tRNA (guanosine(37)-N1)-methyltransferase TrmD [Oscillospiraceae bacterium]|jgi:tRNA (guanine37-N1)-methyltransferase|nr:tRNA (guanosine(37)-N1)-methyltransferase TrmD [Oscillospiraceae bacterium]